MQVTVWSFNGLDGDRQRRKRPGKGLEVVHKQEISAAFRVVIGLCARPILIAFSIGGQGPNLPEWNYPTMKLFTCFALALSVFFGQPAKSQDAPLPAEQRAEVSDHWIESNGARLRASLYRPEGSIGTTGAAILVHGSGPTARENMVFYLRSALEMGLAAVAYDKRGIGESEGEYWAFEVDGSEEQLQLLADDAGAVHDWLAHQDGIDPNAIGYIGGSQAGWTMPQAAATRPNTAFIIIGAGTPLSAGAEAFHEQQLMAGISVAEADISTLAYDGPEGFDPTPALQAVTAPVLWIFGDADNVIPTALSIHQIEALRAAGKQNFDLLVIEGMNHNFQAPRNGDIHQYWVHHLATDWLINLDLAP